MLEIRAEHGEKKLEIKLDDHNENIQNTLISSVVRFLFADEAVTLESKNEEVLDVKEDPKIAVYKDGYQALKAEEKGLHHPKSEFEANKDKIVKNNPYGTDFKMGMKEIEGEKRYQTFYQCTECSHRGKHFLSKSRVYCTCHECGKRLKVRQATLAGFPEQDEYGNFYIAGDYKRTLYDKEQEEKLQESAV